MADYLLELSEHPLGRWLVRGLGAPAPQRLARASGAYVALPLAGRRCVLGGGAPTPVTAVLRGALAAAGAEPRACSAWNGAAVDVAVFDATGLSTVAELRALYDFFHPLAARLAANARVVVVGAPADAARDVEQAAARGALAGFVRSLAKEIGRRGATANLCIVAPGAEDRIAGPLAFLASPRSAYVDGQPIVIDASVRAPRALPAVAPLAGKVALVTGGARGIGAATARRLAEEGAQVICADLPADRDALNATVAGFGGHALLLDLTAPGAADALAESIARNFGGVDLVIHNAGVTRDRTIARMDARLWDACMAVNLAAIVRLDAALLARGLLRDEGRLLCLSSISGIAGNVGQTNYAASKSAVIAYVAAQARALAGRGIACNAVAPGFIETRMMLAVPFLFREAARRLNSLSQGGVPADVAETITFLCTPAAHGVNGQVVRVCGQNLIGA